jgi:hypothetical protein
VWIYPHRGGHLLLSLGGDHQLSLLSKYSKVLKGSQSRPLNRPVMVLLSPLWVSESCLTVSRPSWGAWWPLKEHHTKLCLSQWKDFRRYMACLIGRLLGLLWSKWAPYTSVCDRPSQQSLWGSVNSLGGYFLDLLSELTNYPFYQSIARSSQCLVDHLLGRLRS